MTTFLIILFMVCTCIFWIPVAVFWGLLKSLISLVISIFLSFSGPGVEAFNNALMHTLKAFSTLLTDGFNVPNNIWNWAGDNVIASILLSVISVFLTFKQYKIHNPVNTLTIAFFSLTRFLGAAAVIIGTLYLFTSLIIDMYFSVAVSSFFLGLLKFIYAILALLLSFKVFTVISDAMINRNIERDRKYEINELKQVQRFSMKTMEAILFIIIAIAFTIGALYLFMLLNLLTSYIFVIEK